jgi:hypothetical protein
MSAAVAAFDGAYTGAHWFETICKIRGDELDGAGTHELAHHIRDEATPDEQELGPFTRRKLKQLPIWDLWLSSRWKELDAQQEQNIFCVRCPIPPGITVLSSQLRFAQTYTKASQDQPDERSIYRGRADKKVVLLCRQVDNLAAACADPTVTKGVSDFIAALLVTTIVRLIMGHHGPCTYCSPRAVSHRILWTREQPAVVLHLYSMTMALSLGGGVAPQIMMGHHGPCTL